MVRAGSEVLAAECHVHEEHHCCETESQYGAKRKRRSLQFGVSVWIRIEWHLDGIR